MTETAVAEPGIVARARTWSDRTAVLDGAGPHSYRDLLDASAAAATLLLDRAADLGGARVAAMIPPGFDYLVWQWATWRAGGMAVPLCLTHPAPELEHVLDDARPAVLVVAPEHEDLVGPLARERGARVVSSRQALPDPGALPPVGEQQPALMLYTSGTTGPPKGVVITHANLAAQVTSLVEAWGWSGDDRILLVLPLHHIHGIVNVASCALWTGATCEMHPRFDAAATWERLASGDLTLFMAVPTIYHRLIGAWEAAPPEERRRMSEGCRRLRLMVSGSAALPVPMLEQWREISGHTLLERYGMTEIGMGLSNPLVGERLPGHVGSPLPGVEVRLADEGGGEPGDGTPGEIQVRGPTVFREYWLRPEATAAAFTPEGWFRTGDVAVRDGDVYRILGRASVDIVKTGAEKVSALEVEEVLLRHPAVAEAAVVGVPDPEWGQRLVAAVVPAGEGAEGEALAAWCRERLAPYKVPKEFKLLEALPRNAMGKTTKPEVVRLFTGG